MFCITGSSSNYISKTIASFQSLNNFGILVEWSSYFGEFNADLLFINLKDSDTNFNFIVLIFKVICCRWKFKFDFVFLLVNSRINFLVYQVLNDITFNDIRVEWSDHIQQVLLVSISFILLKNFLWFEKSFISFLLFIFIRKFFSFCTSSNSNMGCCSCVFSPRFCSSLCIILFLNLLASIL